MDKKTSPRDKRRLRHFGYRLIANAITNQKWKTSATVDLFRLLSDELTFETKNVESCFRKLGKLATPKFIAAIIKSKNTNKIPIRIVLDHFFEQAKTLADLCESIEQSVIEEEIMDFDSEDILSEVIHYILKHLICERSELKNTFLGSQCSIQDENEQN